MLNKKLLAASIAATLSTSAFAAGPFVVDSADQKAITYATELATEAADDEGMFTVTNSNDELNIQRKLGFAITAGTSRYIRFTLTDATFSSAVTAANVTLSGDDDATAATVTVLEGGAEDDSTLLLEVSDNQTLVAGSTITVAVPGLNLSTTADAAVSYQFFETLTAAATEGGAALVSDMDNALATHISAVSGAPIVPASSDVEATVDSNFTVFVGDETVANIGSIDVSEVLVSDVLALDSTPVTAAQIFDVDQMVNLNGNVSFGDWYLAPVADDCAKTNQIDLVEATEGANKGAVASADNVNITSADYSVCVNVSALEEDQVIAKGSYSLTLVDDEVNGELADIAYDTLSVEVPYLTTFSDYRQRIYMVNRSNKPVFYTMNFTAEEGITPMALDAATGTIPANKMVAVNATDVVEINGPRTRTAATIEFEATTGQVVVTTQTVGADGSTDTVQLAESSN